MKKINYYYVDEAGNLGNDSNVFIHGCIKTDTPHILKKAINCLQTDLIEDLYFQEFIERLSKEGFHAAENHPDIRTHFYKILPLLDYRAYFVIINKTSNYFSELKKKREDYEIFEYTLTKLIKDRIIRNKHDKNIFYFERIELGKKSLNKILENIFSSFSFKLDVEYHIVGKDEINISVVDYLNYILLQLLEGVKKKSTKIEPKYNRMKMNFDLISSKIGLVNILNTNSFLSRKKAKSKQITYENLINEFGG